MLFKKEEEKITNSTQIKEILDKSKDISTDELQAINKQVEELGWLRGEDNESN